MFPVPTCKGFRVLKLGAGRYDVFGNLPHSDDGIGTCGDERFALSCKCYNLEHVCKCYNLEHVCKCYNLAHASVFEVHLPADGWGLC